VRGRSTAELVEDLTDGSLDGTVVVGALYLPATYGSDRWFRRVPTSGIVALPSDAGEINDVTTAATAISNDGTVVVGNSGIHAVRWDPTYGTRRLPEVADRPAEESVRNYRATNVSGDGTTVVGYIASQGGPTALRWSSADVVVPFGSGIPKAMSKNGDLIVGHDSSYSSNAARIWDASGNARNIAELLGANSDVTGWNLQTAIAISDDGKVIIGTGVNPSAQQEGWVVRLP
jgi:uncharacterized membrane protein